MSELPRADLGAAAGAVAVASAVVEQRSWPRLAASPDTGSEQVLAYDLAHAAAAVRTAEAVLEYGAKGHDEAALACAFVADALADLGSRMAGRHRAWGAQPGWMEPQPNSSSATGTPLISPRCAGPRAIGTSTRTSPSCAKPSIASPRTRSGPGRNMSTVTNADIPEEIISGLAELGGFGLSVPESYGGFASGGESDYMGMVIATEELAWGSLGMGGSLITRPEILSRALVNGRHRRAENALASSTGLGRSHGGRGGHRT